MYRGVFIFILLVATGVGCYRSPEPAPISRVHLDRANDPYADQYASLHKPSIDVLDSSGLPHADVVLADWGLSDIARINYIKMSLQHKPTGDEPVVNDIRTRKPVARTVSTASRTFKRGYGNDVVLVSHFVKGNKNQFGGDFNSFQRSPSTSEAKIAADPDGNRGLRLEYRQPESQEGFAGMWVHLFDEEETARRRVYFDATPYQFLTFKIRGITGTEKIQLRASDRFWIENEDSVLLDDVGTFVGGQITNKWQTAWVDLTKYHGKMAFDELGGITFQARGKGDGGIFIKDMAFARHQNAEIPKFTEPIAGRISRRAMWLWTTQEVMTNEMELKRLAALCQHKGITVVFAQIPYQAKRVGQTWNITWDQANFARFVKAMTAAQIDVHALDGDPRFALESWHGQVEALMRSLIDYNKRNHESARIRGIRFDIEPYLLPAFNGIYKSEIIRQYLVLLDLARDLTKANNLRLGADIPFWLDDRNEYGEPTAALLGRPMMEWIMDRVDDIGIMAYRTRSYGADGVLSAVSNELEYAAKRGREVYVGLETIDLPDETIYEFTATGREARIVIRDMGSGKARLYFVPAERVDDVSNRGLFPEGCRSLAQVKATKVPAAKQTFFHQGSEAVETVMREVEEELSANLSFAGFIIHSYESYKRWIKWEGDYIGPADPEQPTMPSPVAWQIDTKGNQGVKEIPPQSGTSGLRPVFADDLKPREPIGGGLPRKTTPDPRTPAGQQWVTHHGHNVPNTQVHPRWNYLGSRTVPAVQEVSAAAWPQPRYGVRPQGARDQHMVPVPYGVTPRPSRTPPVTDWPNPDIRQPLTQQQMFRRPRGAPYIVNTPRGPVEMTPIQRTQPQPHQPVPVPATRTSQPPTGVSEPPRIGGPSQPSIPSGSPLMPRQPQTSPLMPNVRPQPSPLTPNVQPQTSPLTPNVPSNRPLVPGTPPGGALKLPQLPRTQPGSPLTPGVKPTVPPIVTPQPTTPAQPTAPTPRPTTPGTQPKPSLPSLLTQPSTTNGDTPHSEPKLPTIPKFPDPDPDMLDDGDDAGSALQNLLGSQPKPNIRTDFPSPSDVDLESEDQGLTPLNTKPSTEPGGNLSNRFPSPSDVDLDSENTGLVPKTGPSRPSRFQDFPDPSDLDLESEDRGLLPGESTNMPNSALMKQLGADDNLSDVKSTLRDAQDTAADLQLDAAEIGREAEQQALEGAAKRLRELNRSIGDAPTIPSGTGSRIPGATVDELGSPSIPRMPTRTSPPPTPQMQQDKKRTENQNFLDLLNPDN